MEVSVPVYGSLSSVTAVLILLPLRLPGARVDGNKVCLHEEDPLPSWTGQFRRWCWGFQCRAAIFQMQRSHCHASHQWRTPEPWKCPGRVEETVKLHTTILSSSSAATCVLLHPRRLFLDRLRSTTARCSCCVTAQFLAMIAAVGSDLWRGLCKPQ